MQDGPPAFLPHEEPKNEEPNLAVREHSKWRLFLTRDVYWGALLFNIGVYFIPVLYSTLSKVPFLPSQTEPLIKPPFLIFYPLQLWIANIDSSMVATTDAYTYVSILAEVINEGLPRAAYMVIGDKIRQSDAKRVKQIHSLLAFQMLMGLIVSVIILGCAPYFTSVRRNAAGRTILYGP